MGKKKKRSPLQNWLEYISFRLLRLLVSITPLTLSNWIGKQIGILAYLVLADRRRLTQKNLEQALNHGFLEKQADVRKLAGEVWANMGVVGSEFLYYYVHGFRSLKERVVLKGAENLERVLAKKKGAILVMAHFGNWELLGMYLAGSGYALSPLVKLQSNPFVDRIIQANRESIGMKVIPNRGFLRPVVQAFKRNEIVPFLVDQLTRKHCVKTEFFGRPASFPAGAVEFALKTGTPVIFGYMVREGKLNYRVVISEEIPMEQTGDYQQDLASNIGNLIGMIQDMVNQYPTQWLWMHRLWRN